MFWILIFHIRNMNIYYGIMWKWCACRYIKIGDLVSSKFSWFHHKSVFIIRVSDSKLYVLLLWVHVPITVMDIRYLYQFFFDYIFIDFSLILTYMVYGRIICWAWRMRKGFVSLFPALFVFFRHWIILKKEIYFSLDYHTDEHLCEQ